METHDKGEVLTGVFYVDTQKPDFSTLLNTVDEPLATLPESRTRPSRAVLAAIMEAHQ
jgi:2-oxoglutarate ferredoxin oxidoreductase subunit beta